MKYIKYLGLLCGAVMLTLSAGCDSSKSKNPFGAGGSPSSLAVVLPDSLDTPELRDSIRIAFQRPVQILPQNEPMQDVMFTTHKNFTSMFRSLRNVLYVSIDHNFYTHPSVGISHDDYAEGQIIMHAKAESVESFYKLLRQRGDMLSKMIYQEETKRWGQYLEKTYASKMAKMVEDSIQHITINAPVEMEYLQTGKDFVWGSNMDQNKRMDVVVYSFPYTYANTFTLDYLIHKRDSVMAVNIKGQYEGSFMTTEKRVRPQFRAFTYNDAYRAEIRGLWSMENDMMGGPFVMHAVLDGATQRVIVAEAFVYAPGDKKRNLMLYAESALYTLRPAGSDFKTHKFEDKEEQKNESNDKEK